MKLVIDIDEETYKAILDCAKNTPGYLTICERIIADGKPLPKGHGNLIDRDNMIARLEAASKFFGGECVDAFDEKLSQGFKEAAIKVAGALTIIEADKAESEDKAIEQEPCANIPFLLHKEFGCPLDECVKAYEKANEYLRSKSKLKG